MTELRSAGQLLGLAQRAGAVVRGVDAVRRALRAGEARLVIVAGDASTVQLKKVRGLLEHREVPCRTLGDRSFMGAALGGPPLSAVAVTEEGFAERLLRSLGDAPAP